MSRKKNSINISTNFFKLAGVGLAVLLCVFVLFSMIYTINEQQQGVVLTFGNPTSTVGSGPHIKIPFVQSIRKVDTTTRGFPIGYDINSNATVSSESTMITSDFNFVDADFYVEWKVSDPIKYLYSSSSPTDILKNISQSSIRNVVGNTTVDTILTTGKSEAQAKIKELMIKELDQYDLGLQVVNITIQDVTPPTAEVVNAFKSVENAKQAMDTAINEATSYKNEQLPAARANADKIIQNAEATKESRINEANGQVARFNEMFSEYIKNPQITKLRLFYETMEDVMPGLKVIIDDGSGVNKIYPIESFSSITNYAESQPVG